MWRKADSSIQFIVIALRISCKTQISKLSLNNNKLFGYVLVIESNLAVTYTLELQPWWDIVKKTSDNINIV